LLGLFGLTALTGVSEITVNVVTLLGIGLAVDYALLVIARFLAGIQKGVPPDANWRVEPKTVNGEPGMIMWLEGRIFNTWSFHVENGKIQSIYIVLNPDKLMHLKKQHGSVE
jgi:hypothetical protein